MSEQLKALRSSVEQLGQVASRLDSSDYTSSAYPTEWTIADTFSHIGSGAQIFERLLEDALKHRDADPAFNQSVWDQWNAKDPMTQVADALRVDSRLLEALEATTEEQRGEVHVALGPMTLDFDRLVGMRLSEHVAHTWDIEVILDPDAQLNNDAANLILDNVHAVVRRAGKATGEEETLAVRTTDPVRDFTLALGAESVSLSDATHSGTIDLELPAETFVRLIYGRLDAQHTPSGLSTYNFDSLRRAFPGF
jgi:uncharacterized protein (TIGR03083 family)